MTQKTERILNFLHDESQTGRSEVEHACKSFLKQRVGKYAASVTDREEKQRQYRKLRKKPIPKSWLLRAMQGQNNLCFYCERGGVKLTGDHYMPLAHGGEHRQGNIVAACESCNSEKSNMLPMEFFKRTGKLLKII